MAIKSDRWYHSSREGVTASWISKVDLEEQKVGLPPAEYSRLWMNKWQETGGEFVTLEECEKCRDIVDDKGRVVRRLKEESTTQADGWQYVAAVDYAEKHDRTVGVVVHQEGNLIIVDRMDVVCPKKTGAPTRVDWVENWMENVQQSFSGKRGNVYFVIDQYQLLGVRQRLEDRGFAITEYPFASGKGNWILSYLLRHFIIHGWVRWYKGCGALKQTINDPYERDDLETELASLVVRHYRAGKTWRFEHLQDNVHHDDRAFALGAAVRFIVEQSGYGTWGIITPDQTGMFNFQEMAVAA